MFYPCLPSPMLSHYQELDAGMNAKQFDVLVHLFQETLLEAMVKDKITEDACRLLQSLRHIFENKDNATSGNNDDSEPQKVEIISLEALMNLRREHTIMNQKEPIEMKPEDKIENLKAKRIRILENVQAKLS
jgi:hypothetical protein